ncbi:MAG TPA: GGDEF domain-containing protein [Pseudonocardia sp.]|nr:GGDEF domain-containing protein [Pseudonocardia sp.]
MGDEPSLVHPWRLARWAIWSLPPRVVTPLLLVELTALGLLLLDLMQVRATGPELLTCVAIALLGVVHTELAVRLERVRRRATDTPHVDLSSVWTFAAAMVLPPLLAGVVVLVIFTYQWWRVWRAVGVPGYRHVFSTATVVLACHAAGAVLGYGGGAVHGQAVGGSAQVLLIGVAILAYGTVNTGLIAAAIAMSTPRPRPSPTELVGHWDDNMLELGTLCLGALAASALGSNPWHVLLVLAPLLVLHRSVLVRQLEREVSLDSKTGLLNAAAWHSEAARELRRARRGRTSAAVLILDLDHFKSVNDDHGHLVGDEVLSAVADTVRTEVREHDLVGRFGGEEFVVLLPDLAIGEAGASELYSIAERIRYRVSTLSVPVSTPGGPLTVGGLSVSVGGARFPDHGQDVNQLLGSADTVLYDVKRDGRNGVRIAELSEVPFPRPSTRG